MDDCKIIINEYKIFFKWINSSIEIVRVFFYYYFKFFKYLERFR